MISPYLDDTGPIDYLVMEFKGWRAPGEGARQLLDLVDRGIIRILDLAFIRKEEDGAVVRLYAAELSPELRVFDGAASGLLDQDDIDTVGTMIAPGSAAGMLVYENRWAAPLAVALRRGGGQLLASGRIHVQALLARLDALETGADMGRTED
jgi:hypothetical protein